MSTVNVEVKLEPLSDNIVVEPFEKKETTAGGFVLPDSAQQQSTEGKVIAVGRGRMLTDGTVSPLQVKVGDVVLFDRRMSMEISSDEKDFLVMKEDSIFAIVRK